MHEIFISYRRADSAYAAARIHDYLAIYFGRESVFRDVDGIRAGKYFPDQIATTLEHCKVGIIVIGPSWLTASIDGMRRIDMPDDYVRIEIETLLTKGVAVIPVLISDAARPKPEELPASISNMAFLQTIALPPNRQFNSGMLEIVEEISAATGMHFEDYASTLIQCQHLGLVAALDNFQNDKTHTVRDEIEAARDLIAVMNDGRNFVNDNQEILRRRLQDPNKFSQFVFYHPSSDFLPTLIRKNKKGARQLSEMKASFDLLASANAVNLIIKGHYLFNPYSLVLTENYAFVSTYRFMEGGALPLFKFSAQQRHSYYHTLREDVLNLIATAEPLQASDFDRA